MIQKQKAYKQVDGFGAISALCRNLPNLVVPRFGGTDEDSSSEFSRLYGFEANELGLS